MKSSAIKTSFRLLAVVLLILFCVSIGYAETERPFTISIINNTDIVMIQATYWLNHDLPDCRGPYNVCVAELQPGANQTFNFGIAASKARIFITKWCACGDYYNELEEYKSRVVSIIPTDAVAVKIYHKHYKVIPLQE